MALAGTITPTFWRVACGNCTLRNARRPPSVATNFASAPSSATYTPVKNGRVSSADTAKMVWLTIIRITSASISPIASASARGSVGKSPAGSPKISKLLASQSEEHTSELQSHSDLVCRLLLEKKKKKIENNKHQ